MPIESSNGPVPRAVPLTTNQIRGFWAAWGGWTLDGMDSFIYALVLLPSLRDLLPRSGIAPTKGNLGYYGGLLFALFLLGWGLAFLWGPLGDKFGRVRTLMLTIVWYSVFTFLSALVTERLAVGDSSLPRRNRNRRGMGHGRHIRRGRMAGNSAAGWSRLHAHGLLRRHFSCRHRQLRDRQPLWLARDVRRRWSACATSGLGPSWSDRACAMVRQIRNRSLLANLSPVRNAFFACAAPSHDLELSIHACLGERALGRNRIRARSGHFARGSCWTRRSRSGRSLASRATMLVAFATILGCLAMPWLAERLGRRGALGFFFALMMMFIARHLRQSFLSWSIRASVVFCLPVFSRFRRREFCGLYAVASGAVPTECRASAFAFSTSFARFGGAAITFLVGNGVQRYGSLGIPVATTALAFAVGLFLIPFGAETRGHALPA